MHSLPLDLILLESSNTVETRKLKIKDQLKLLTGYPCSSCLLHITAKLSGQAKGAWVLRLLQNPRHFWLSGWSDLLGALDFKMKFIFTPAP